jgi:hypothetical protein
MLDRQIFFYYFDILNKETFCYGDVLLRRRCVTGDVMLRRHSVTEMFCMETFCRGDVSSGDVLYVRQNYHVGQRDSVTRFANLCFFEGNFSANTGTVGSHVRNGFNLLIRGLVRFN